MVLLEPLSNFINPNGTVNNSSPIYYYQGYCPQTAKLLQLPRTALAEAIAHGLMAQLAEDELYSREGKMYGIILIKQPNGEQQILKAFSGLLNGCSDVEGWVPSIPGREEVRLDEARTLAELEAIKQELIQLAQIYERLQYQELEREFVARLQDMNKTHSARKQQRHEKRQILAETLAEEALETANAQLEEESRQDGIERKLLKRERNKILQPIKKIIDNADIQMRELKRKRKELSRQLQTRMHAAYSLMNFYGRSQTLQELSPQGLPTGTGDCCAPKLLHYAATHNLQPLAMAEFWWGASSGDKIQGQFYGACVERCQPLMGFLLSGLTKVEGVGSREQREIKNIYSLPPNLKVIYEDEWLIAVNKPSGLLSVPGRYSQNQDSVVSRLRNLLPDAGDLLTVHRLDMDTSGVLVLARYSQAHRLLNQQFQERRVHKVYEAILAGHISQDEGVIELPLWGNAENRPYQQVNWEHGKPSMTKFRVIAQEGNYTRVEFFPITGRTHQLRVHAAHPQGLDVPILGDRFYGNHTSTDRLHLHAKELFLLHPHTNQQLHLKTHTPF